MTATLDGNVVGEYDIQIYDSNDNELDVDYAFEFGKTYYVDICTWDFNYLPDVSEYTVNIGEVDSIINASPAPWVRIKLPILTAPVTVTYPATVYDKSEPTLPAINEGLKISGIYFQDTNNYGNFEDDKIIVATDAMLQEYVNDMGGTLTPDKFKEILEGDGFSIMDTFQGGYKYVFEGSISKETGTFAGNNGDEPQEIVLVNGVVATNNFEIYEGGIAIPIDNGVIIVEAITPDDNNNGGNGNAGDNDNNGGNAGDNDNDVTPTDNEPSEGVTDEAAKTGDDSNMALWIALMAIAAVAGTGTVLCRRKNTVK